MRLVILLIVFSGISGFSQSIIQGRVVNERTKGPLPFVNIGVAGTTRGTSTDVDGRFQLKVFDSDTLLFSYVGYWKKKIASKELNERAVIELKEKPTELNEVVVRPGENPAWKIIRKVINNREVNDPEKLKSFVYNCYNKLYGTMINPSIDPNLPIMDTSKAKKFFDKSHLFVYESYTKRYYQSPNQTKEVVLGNQMTGVQDPFFSIVATDILPLTLYGDYIRFFDKSYLNPISKGFEDRYDYVIEDTVYQEHDSTFVISFQPFDGKSFDAMKGQVHIATDGYAIKNMIAEPADSHGLIMGKLHHMNEKVNGHWFPIQINTDLRFKEFGVGTLRLRYISSSYLSNIQIEPELDKTVFGTLNVVMDDKANHQTNEFWNISRSDSLTRKDKNTFHLYDSLAPKLKFINTVMKLAEMLATSKFRLGPVDLPIADLAKFNQYEKARVGLGLQTGSKISKVFSLHGYAGYGIKDQAWKYGGDVHVKLPLRRETQFGFGWRQDIEEPGQTRLAKSPIIGNEAFRTWATSRMDSIRQYKFDVLMRPIAYSEVQLQLKNEIRNPTYHYHYLSEGKADSSFHITEATLTLRYAVGEKYMQIRDSKIITGLDYPQLYLSLSRSLSGVLNGEYAFTKVEARVDHKFLWRGFGNTLVSLQGGVGSGNIPYPYLFNGKGTRFSGSVNNNIVIPNYFQTMGLYEFASSRYAYLFLHHNLGRIVSPNSKRFRPELSLIHNMGYGSLQRAEQHIGLDFKTMNKGFYESGMLVNNLIRFTYAKLFYLGLGGGVFYRYGSYSLPNQNQNFVAKFMLSVSF